MLFVSFKKKSGRSLENPPKDSKTAGDIKNLEKIKRWTVNNAKDLKLSIILAKLL